MKATKKITLFIIIMVVFLAAAAPIFAAGNDTQKAKKILVVYYSATGTTERLANIIAKEMKADIFVLKPKKPYTSADLNWNNKNSRVVKEHELGVDKVSVALETTKVPKFDAYDTVFIGYPIWWGEAAWVVDEFIKKNDFTGKNVIAFALQCLQVREKAERDLKNLRKQVIG